MPKKIDIIGKRFGRLVVLEKTDKKISNGTYIYKCKCDCGKELELPSARLINGHNRSCGCLRSEFMKQKQKKYNKIEIENDIAKIYFFNSRRYAIIDAEDIDKIKDYCWFDRPKKYYPSALIEGRQIELHRVIKPNNDKKFVIDHINRNPLDNRKCNLRIVTQCVNCQNTDKPITNTTGYKNISYLKTRNVYVVSFCKNKQNHYVGSYKNLETAIQNLEKYKKEKKL